MKSVICSFSHFEELHCSHHLIRALSFDCGLAFLVVWMLKANLWLSESPVNEQRAK